MTPLRLEPAAPRSRVKHSTTEPPRSQHVASLYKMYYSFSKKNNKGADQPAHPRRLVSALVIRKLPKTGFLASRLIITLTETKHCANNRSQDSLLLEEQSNQELLNICVKVTKYIKVTKSSYRVDTTILQNILLVFISKGLDHKNTKKKQSYGYGSCALHVTPNNEIPSRNKQLSRNF